MNWFAALVTLGLICSMIGAASGFALLVGASKNRHLMMGGLIILVSMVTVSMMVGLITA